MRSIVTKKWKNLWVITFNSIHYIINFFTFLNANNRIKKLMSCFEYLRLRNNHSSIKIFNGQKCFLNDPRKTTISMFYFIWEKIENTSLKIKFIFQIFNVFLMHLTFEKLYLIFFIIFDFSYIIL